MMPENEYGLLIPQYLAGELKEAERQRFETQLAVDAALRGELEQMRALWEGLASLPEEYPSPAMRARFYQKLHAPAPISKRFVHWNFGAFAQASLALLIFAIGVYVGHTRVDEKHTEEMAQVQSLREMVALSLLDRQSATSRLEGVSWSSRVDRPNQELLAALLMALNKDANVNVRLSSLNALERFAKNAAVGQALIDSIQGQDSPLMQIALIDSLVQIRSHAAAPELKKLTVDSTVDPAVRQRAQWGLQKLNFE